MKQNKNLFVFHLESVSWQTVHSFPESFPNLHDLMARARTYSAYFSSATSTQMVVAALLHGNDFEMDAEQRLSSPAGNNPSLLKTLAAAGYDTHFLCATQFPRRQMLRMFSGSIPEIWSTNDFGQMLGRFEAIVKGPPFAVYVWCQLPHTDANVALASYARQIDELIAGGCAVSDTLLGAMLEILRRENRTDDTTAVVHGDHGDDYWTHGFKNGLLHGVEPFTSVIHAPLVILDRKLPQGRDGRLVSTVDLAPTCLDLLGMPWAPSFSPSGRSILDRERRSIAFSQNRTANQVLILKHAPQKCFSASDHSYNLLVSPRGLELYNYRVDPGNQFNILNFFNMKPDGELAMVLPPYGARPHFNAFHHMWRGEGLRDAFRTLRTELREHVAAKSRYVTERVQGRPDLLDQAAFARINRSGWREFFRVPRWAGPGPGGRVSLRRLHKENILELVGPTLQRLYRMIVRDRRRQGQ